VLDPAYQNSVFGDVLDAIIQNDWDFQSQGVVVDELVRALDEPDVVVRQCCRVYGTIQPGGERCTFDGKKIAIFCAKQLFKERDEGHYKAQSFTRADQGWALDQFMDKWQLRVPEPVKVIEEMLQGLVLMKPQKGKAARLVYLAEDELPMDPKQRFDKLFEFQEKWTIAQLEPYIRYGFTWKGFHFGVTDMRMFRGCMTRFQCACSTRGHTGLIASKVCALLSPRQLKRAPIQQEIGYRARAFVRICQRLTRTTYYYYTTTVIHNHSIEFILYHPASRLAFLHSSYSSEEYDGERPYQHMGKRGDRTMLSVTMGAA
jgi:hypothetical protein